MKLMTIMFPVFAAIALTVFAARGEEGVGGRLSWLSAKPSPTELACKDLESKVCDQLKVETLWAFGQTPNNAIRSSG
jgi:hypothetical protein